MFQDDDRETVSPGNWNVIEARKPATESEDLERDEYAVILVFLLPPRTNLLTKVAFQADKKILDEDQDFQLLNESCNISTMSAKQKRLVEGGVSELSREYDIATALFSPKDCPMYTKRLCLVTASMVPVIGKWDNCEVIALPEKVFEQKSTAMIYADFLSINLH